MKKVKKGIAIASYVVLIIIVCLFTFYTVFNLVAPHKTVSVFGFKTYTVKTASMEPTIMTGDTVVVKKVDCKDLKPGDIIAFYRNSTGSRLIITHYVRSIEKDADLKKGYRIHTKPEKMKVFLKDEDGNPILDDKGNPTFELRDSFDREEIYEYNVIGKVSKIHHKKSFVGFITNPIVVGGIVIAIAIISITVSAVLSVVKKEAKDKPENTGKFQDGDSDEESFALNNKDNEDTDLKKDK